ncbi:MAG: hypothetical protein AAFO04_17105 [Cyanobacteria bacterium J06592_8]
MGCFTRFATAVTLVAGTQLSFVGMAQARFQPNDQMDRNLCQVTSASLKQVTCRFKQGEETGVPGGAPGTGGAGGAR